MKTLSFTDDFGNLLYTKPSIITPVEKRHDTSYLQGNKTVGPEYHMVRFLVDSEWLVSREYKTSTEANAYRLKLIEWAEQP